MNLEGSGTKWSYPGGTEENRESFRTACVPAEIRTENLPNTSLELELPGFPVLVSFSSQQITNTRLRYLVNVSNITGLRFHILRNKRHVSSYDSSAIVTDHVELLSFIYIGSSSLLSSHVRLNV
jgi:hypothetical protein